MCRPFLVSKCAYVYCPYTACLLGDAAWSPSYFVLGTCSPNLLVHVHPSFVVLNVSLKCMWETMNAYFWLLPTSKGAHSSPSVHEFGIINDRRRMHVAQTCLQIALAALKLCGYTCSTACGAYSMHETWFE